MLFLPVSVLNRGSEGRGGVVGGEREVEDVAHSQKGLPRTWGMQRPPLKREQPWPTHGQTEWGTPGLAWPYMFSSETRTCPPEPWKPLAAPRWESGGH